jgi:serine/threonine-protein kinase
MTAPSSLIGAQLGPYQIQALLGSGGMATVYRGLDIHLQRPVAIKVLSTTLAGDPDYVRRFKREAQLIASLRHPNVAQVYAFGEQGGAPYMVQELLPGPTLEERLRELAAAGRLLPRADVLAVVSQLAAALGAAHALGVIHRDVKPSNAITNAQGELVLTDFGIARSAADTNLTQPGVVMGTPAYVAPEQAISSAALTPAADIYALGVLLFQLLTGRLPFEADTPTAVVIKHLYEAPPALGQLRADLPPAIDAVVKRALEKEPADRYQRAEDLAAALAQAWPAVAAPSSPAAIHSLPTTAWTPPGAAAPPASAGPTQARQPAVAPVAHPPATAPRRASPLPLLGAALIVLLIIGGLAAWRGGAAGTAAPAAAPTPAAATAVVAASLPDPTLAPTADTAPAPTAAPAPPPTEAPTAAPVAADPVATLGELFRAGQLDGSAGADVEEYLQRYGYLVDAISGGDDKRAEEEIRELSRKIAERAREGKLDQAFNDQSQTLLQAIAGSYGLKGPSERGDD